MNKLDVRVPDSSVRCVRDLWGHVGPGCAGRIGFLRHLSVRVVFGYGPNSLGVSWSGRCAWERAGMIVAAGIVGESQSPWCLYCGRRGR